MAGKTRAELEQIIIQGGSVIIDGRVISRVQDLPSAAQLAAGDPQAEATTLKDIDRQIAALQKQRAALEKQIVAREKAATKADESGGAAT